MIFFYNTKTMLSFLYTIIIYPIAQIIEFFYVLFINASKNQGISIIGVSFVFTLLCLPLYIVAEKWQETERQTQAKMKKQTERIKKAFKGDEQYMMLTTFYRQSHYHPLMALRSSFGLMIQIPFFIAAYSFLSHLQQLQGASFLFIGDMGKPDALFTIGSFTVNILPIAMTLINIVSGMIYSRGHGAREKIQIFVSAGLFLVLLYKMPAGLVLYWTMNNIFSTLKNICYKLPKKVFLISAYSAAVALYIGSAYYLLFVHTGNFQNRLLLVVAGLIIPLSPAIIKIGSVFFSKIHIEDKKSQFTLFAMSSYLLCILLGFALPSFVVYSSPVEFSNIDGCGSPLTFLRNTLFQSIGFCVFYPVCLFFLFNGANGKVKSAFSVMAVLAATAALVDSFVFSGDYGNLSASLVFDNRVTTSIPVSLVNLAVLALCTAAACSVIRLKKYKIFEATFSILILALGAVSFFNAAKIQGVYKTLKPVVQIDDSEIEPIYSLSKTKKNVVVFFLDRFTSSFFPEIIKEAPELSSVYSGFTYYPNTISYGLHTIVGSPAMLGGYDFRPELTNGRKGVPLQDKINEGISTMPFLFRDLGFEVTFANPTDAETQRGFFDEHPEIKTPNTNGTYRKMWYARQGSEMLPVKSALIKRNFIWFSFFKCAPVIARKTIYKNNWWSSENLQDTDNFVDAYSALDLLPELTSFESERDTFTIVHNLLPHEPMYLDAPEYTLPKDRSKIKTSGSAYGGITDYYPAAASIHLLAKWIDALQAAGVYDNTRIIVASDHGVLIRTGVFKDNTVCQVEGCNPLLMFKDFGDGGELKTDGTFMTQCDVAVFATKVYKAMDDSAKHGKQHLFMNHNNTLMKNNADSYRAKDTEWYTVENNIFDPANWTSGRN